MKGMVGTMVKRKSDYSIQENVNMRGGDGTVVLEHLLTPDELYNKGRLYARFILEPGCSIGPHTHEGEMESFYIISGEAEVFDNGEIVKVSAGDCTLTRSGEEHSVKNTGSSTLEMIGVILHK